MDVKQYSDTVVLFRFMRKMLLFAHGHGLGKRRWYERHRLEVRPGQDPWFLEGIITNGFIFPTAIFSVRLRLGWQEGNGETLRLLYWNMEWDKSDRYNFSSLCLGAAEAVLSLSRLLGRDGVILEPSPEMLIEEEFGSLGMKKPNGHDQHITVPFPDEATGLSP